MRIPDPEAWKQTVLLELDMLSLMAMHGYLCLALRHPATRGIYSRPQILLVVERIERALLESDMLSEEELAAIDAEKDLRHDRAKH